MMYIHFAEVNLVPRAEMNRVENNALISSLSEIASVLKLS